MCACVQYSGESTRSLGLVLRSRFIIGIEIDRITLTKLDLIKNAFAFAYCSGVSRKYLVSTANNFGIRFRHRLRFRLHRARARVCTLYSVELTLRQMPQTPRWQGPRVSKIVSNNKTRTGRWAPATVGLEA